MPPFSPGRPPAWRRLVASRALALSAALLMATPALSQTPRLSLNEALRLGLAADPAANAFRARLDAAKANVRQADTRPNPSLGLEVENFTGSGRFAALDRTETTLSYHQAYERGGKRQARTLLAQREVDLAAVRAQVRRLDLAKAVQLAFIGVLAADAEVLVAEDQATVAQRAHDEVSRRVAGARDPLFAGARSEAELAQARVSLDRANANARNARAALAAYWSGEAGFIEPIELFEDIRQPPVSPVSADMPDLRLLAVERDIAVARIAVEQARAVQDPSLSLGVRHLQNEGAMALVVGGTLPLGRYDTNRGAIDRARSERTAVEADLEALRLEREREIALLIARRAAAVAEVRRTDDEVLPSAQRAVTLVGDGFRRGGFSYLDVIAAQRALIEARSRRVEILKAFHQDGASLDRLTGAHAELASTETQP